jgi:hypothetical protein
MLAQFNPTLEPAASHSLPLPSTAGPHHFDIFTTGYTTVAGTMHLQHLHAPSIEAEP